MITAIAIAILVGGGLGAGYLIHLVDLCTCRHGYRRHVPPTARALQRAYKRNRLDLRKVLRR